MVRLRTPPKGLVGKERETERKKERHNDTIITSDIVIPHPHIN